MLISPHQRPRRFPTVVPLSGVELISQFPLYPYRIKDQGLEPSNLKIQDLNVSFCQSVVRVLTRFTPSFWPLSEYVRVNNANVEKESITVNN